MHTYLLRSVALRILFVITLVACAVGLAPASASAGDGEPLRVMGGLFTPTRTGDGVSWDARWVLPYDASATLETPHLIRFAVPLPEGATLRPRPGVAAVVEGGRLVGVTVERAALEGPGARAVRVEITQPLPRAATEGIVLGAPVARGSGVQIIDGDLGAGARFEVEAKGGGLRGGLERHVGFTAPSGVEHSAREEARRLTGYSQRVSGAPIYVRGEDVRAMGPLRASVVTGAARKNGGAMAVGFGFAAVVTALVVAMKKLRDRASVERADAILAAEVDSAATRAGLGTEAR